MAIYKISIIQVLIRCGNTIIVRIIQYLFLYNILDKNWRLRRKYLILVLKFLTLSFEQNLVEIN